MKLLDGLRALLELWAPIFPQVRTRYRAIGLAWGILCGVGKRTLTRAITFQGNTQKDWSADYKVFSRSPWEAQALFGPILQRAIQTHSLTRIVAAIDDTRVWRNGQKVPETQYHRDPLSPPFQANLRWGHRFLQASLILPLYRQDGESSSRAVPVRFEMAPVVKKPGKKASPAKRKAYDKLKKEQNLSRQFVRQVKDLRQELDQGGQEAKRLFVVADGSFCNRTVFGEDWEAQNVTVLTRCRKDIVLCRRATGKTKRFYSQAKFTPEMVRKDHRRARWQKAWIFHGGCRRLVRFKEVTRIYWQGGAKKREVRLLIVAPVGYRTTKHGRTYYRRPAYLLTTDLHTPAEALLQDYFDRWEIEVNHRDEKEILGIGEAQVWNPKSVRKVPAMLVAMYSWLLLAGLECYGPTRTAVYEPLPKWRRGAKRPSCLDLVTLLRQQMAETGFQWPTASKPASFENMVVTANA